MTQVMHYDRATLHIGGETFDVRDVDLSCDARDDADGSLLARAYSFEVETTVSGEEAKPFLHLMDSLAQEGVRRAITDARHRWVTCLAVLWALVNGVPVPRAAVRMAKRMLAGRYHTETAKRRAMRRILRRTREADLRE